jgi:RNA ligase
MLPFTREELAAAIDDGRVTARRHPSLPLTIYNYSPAVQYSQRWDEITLTCRGLILDDDFNIIARPWRKFFNLGQVDLPIQLTDPVEVMDKADGSLGILYPDGDGYAVATRGSFTSDQAIHASKVWKEKYDGLHPMGGVTPLFEIIYPENRIVLNYDGMDDLILLGAVTNDGYYQGPQHAKSQFFMYVDGVMTFTEWPGPVVEVFNYANISEALAHTDRPNAEGYVIRSHNFLVKLKQPDYLDLHRIVTNLTPKTVWERLRDGRTVADICGDMPDEFHSMVRGYADPILKRYEERAQEIMDGFWEARGRVVAKSSHTPEAIPRAEFAKVFSKHKDSGYYFAMLDGKTDRVMTNLWNELKPKETSLGEIKDSLHV